MLNFFFISVLVIIYFNILPDFSANIYFYPITLENKLFCLFRPCKQFFFNISHTPLQKNNCPRLSIISINQLSDRFGRYRPILIVTVWFRTDPLPPFFLFLFLFLFIVFAFFHYSVQLQTLRCSYSSVQLIVNASVPAGCFC